MNYPLKSDKKYHNILTPLNTFYSEEYTRRIYDLYLTEEFQRNEYGKITKYYRLNAKYDHNQEQAFAYDIKCPKCGAILKQVARQNSYTELGLYTCRNCNKH